MNPHASGLGAWWVQRASAACMLLLLLAALVLLWLHPVRSYAGWRGTMGQPAVAICAGLFFAALLSHMGVGLRDVLIDYARPAALQRRLMYLTGFTLLGIAGWVLWILVQAQA